MSFCGPISRYRAGESAPLSILRISIPMLSGVDVIIDGHSHSTVDMEKVKDKDGKSVLLTQTGTKFASIGKLTIAESGEMKTELIEEYEKKDPDMEKTIAEEKTLFEGILARKVGHTEYKSL